LADTGWDGNPTVNLAVPSKLARNLNTLGLVYTAKEVRRFSDQVRRHPSGGTALSHQGSEV